VEDFLAATKRFNLSLFEPNGAVSIESGRITCTQEERREGKRGPFFWLLESIGRPAAKTAPPRVSNAHGLTG
jgi:hypothetical protein